MNEIEQLISKLQKIEKRTSELMKVLAVGEGVHAVAEAKRICKQDKIVNTGNYRNNWKSDAQPVHTETSYTVRVYNNSNYATHLEYGFRAHFVPGKWEGHTFHYIKGYGSGGMYVGKRGEVVQGHFTLKRATERTVRTQQARLGRKAEAWLRENMEAGK